MPDLMTLYGPPGHGAAARAGQPDIVEIDMEDLEDGVRFVPADPDFTVWRDRSLYLVGPRETLLEELGRRGSWRVTIANGVCRLTVRRGTSTAGGVGREVLGVVKGAPKALLAAAFAQNSSLAAGLVMGPSRDRERRTAVRSVVEVSSAVSNHHHAALNAAFRAQGAPGPASNSHVIFSLLADMLRRDHGF